MRGIVQLTGALKRRTVILGAAALLALASPAAALADDCVNVSRGQNAQATPLPFTMKGNWLYVSDGGSGVWIFITPGSPLWGLLANYGVTPGSNASNGNFMSAGDFAVLLQNALFCREQEPDDPYASPRPTDQGIQSCAGQH